MTARFFIEVAYQGARYAGFQKQENANSIQSEVERALRVYYREAIDLTGSSRTDAGVHAYQNYFHFDYRSDAEETMKNSVYHLNAILPEDIVINRIARALDGAHCRFDAVSREYEYRIYRSKNPFIKDRAYYFPYTIDIDRMNEAAEMIRLNEDFQSFSKKNTQVHNYVCKIEESYWKWEGDMLIYKVKGNRFLRGMVRGLAGTMLRLGTNKLNIDQFQSIIQSKDCKKVDFSTPPHGLILVKVNYKVGVFKNS